MEQYRLSWDMVTTTYLHLYANADPLYYSNTTQIVPNSEIPDEHWHHVEKVRKPSDEDMTDQYRQLKEWADNDTGYVRNVKLERAVVPEPVWEEVTP